MVRLILLLGLFVIQSCLANVNFVFSVKRKFKVSDSSLDTIKIHDSRRRGRFLSAVDIPLGGDGLVNSTGLYYGKLGLGSPVKDFYVLFDTGSPILWVNCVGCTACPKNSTLGMDMTLYDPNHSKTSDLVSCDDDFCKSKYHGPISGCKQDMSCAYRISYGDGSTSSGSYMKDYLTFNRINGNLRSVPESGTVIFGCGTFQNQPMSPHDSLDGIAGFAPSNFSVLSQLAASGKVKRIFSHCLDSINGGGIFSIGEVVAPKFNVTPLVPKTAHYNLVMKDIEVDGEVIQLRMDRFDTGNGTRTIIDSGTTLAYLPPSIYDQLVTKIAARQPGLKLYFPRGDPCFYYNNNLDDGFPVVKFHFEGLSLTVFPHDYMIFQTKIWCIGWEKAPNEDEPILLGDLVLSNKLVVYDLEKMAIGWTDYNCSSSIKVKDDKTGSVYTVGGKHLSPAKHLSSAFNVLIGRILTFFLLLIALLVT